jgi:hypothetical protein
MGLAEGSCTPTDFAISGRRFLLAFSRLERDYFRKAIEPYTHLYFVLSTNDLHQQLIARSSGLNHIQQ